MNKLRKSITYAFIMYLGLMQIGCGGSTTTNSLSADTNSGVYYDSGFSEGMSYDYGAESYMQSYSPVVNKHVAISGESGSKKVNTEQKLIRTVSMTVELESSDLLNSASSDISSLAGKYNGYITYNNIDMDTRYASGNITTKVPKENVDSFLNEVKENGYNVKNIIDSSEDVTLDYTDVQSRLSVKLKARQRYESILEKAETIDEIISVQSKLDSITEEIESTQAKLNVLNNKIDYTEISIYLNCKTSVDRESFWVRAGNRLGDIFYNAGDTFISGIEWFINAAIVLLFFVPIAVILIKIFLITIGKRKFSLKNVLKFKGESKEDKESTKEGD